MLLFILILMAVAVLAEKWSADHALDGVEARQYPLKHLAEPGEDLTVVTKVTNRSRRFIPFVRVLDNPPTFMGGRKIGFIDTDEAEWLTPEEKEARVCSTYLLPRQCWERKEAVRLPNRGRYIFQGLALAGGDFLGLREQRQKYAQFEEVVIIPPCSEDTKALTVLAGFFGERSVRRFLFEDPVLTLGVREYTGREPQKMISWTRSAQLGQLMVKNYDYTVEESADVILNIERPRSRDTLGALEEYFSTTHETMEDCFSLARSVCEMLEERKIRCRFITNASAAGALGIWSRIGDGLGQEHLDMINEGLGRATYQAAFSASVLMKKAAGQAEIGRSQVLITPAMFPELEQGVKALERATGTKVLILTPRMENEKEESL